LPYDLIFKNRRVAQDPDKPKPTLTYALHCIEAATKLFDSDAVRRDGVLPVKPSNPITNPNEISDLKANVLCTGAYVALNLGNYSYAITFCKELLEMENVSSTFQ
jgi:hypothetical protein